MAESIRIVSISRNEMDQLLDYAKVLHQKENHSFEFVSSQLKQCIDQNIEYLNPSLSSNNTLLAYYIKEKEQPIPVGFISLAKVFKPDIRNYFIYIDELFVLPSYRKQGIASALLLHVKQMHPFLRLLCRMENTTAQQLYEKHEFVLSQTLMGQYFQQ